MVFTYLKISFLQVSRTHYFANPFSAVCQFTHIFSLIHTQKKIKILYTWSDQWPMQKREYLNLLQIELSLLFHFHQVLGLWLTHLQSSGIKSDCYKIPFTASVLLWRFGDIENTSNKFPKQSHLSSSVTKFTWRCFLYLSVFLAQGS